MIGQIRGIILEKQPPQLLIDVQGVGYEIDAPMSTFYRLPDIGHEIILHTHFVVREDAHHLYGFFDREERALFRTLLKVNGVGPRLGLTILSSVPPEEFIRSVLHHDIDSLVRLPGIGKKTAERLIIEMKDKLSDWHTTSQESNIRPSSSHEPRHAIVQDSIAALISLGFKRDEATRAVNKI
ncbi:MAG TPA: Holliday junction branch migration protein RuvA, partial [Gammaproteobacteria bacterium]|nr:Holliday junction branch migration protein RuvA [Gammaproteobacteria bacterium]